MYRRAVDPTTAIFAQLNFYPIADTMFIDSQCEPGRTYEYRATAVDSEANEGPRSLGVTAKITLYNIVPGNITLVYDTFEQAITLRWSNPDSSRIKGFNVYRRNIDLDEKFWTPYNASPVSECSFVDSAYGICPLCPTYDFPHGDSQAVKPPTYEYCLAALVNGVREGLRSTVVSVDVSVGYITPVDVKAVYDSVKMTVNLSWDVGDTMLIKGFNVYRKAAGDLLTPINGKLVKAKAFSDSGIDPNSTYEYRIASLIKNDRAEVKSAAVTVSIGP
jgi:fibronectin type 3 domain-containing protein